MDPKACLERASTALKDRDYEAAADALGDYRDWRKAYGYEPILDERRPYATRGDDVASAMEHACLLHGYGR